MAHDRSQSLVPMTYDPARGGAANELGLELLSRSRLESDVRQHQRRHIYGRPLQKLSSTASHHVSFRPYDVVFTSLRLVIFQLDPKSATPIAHIIRDELDDGDVFELIKGLDLHMQRASPLTSAPLPASYPRNQSPCIALLRSKIDAARVKHAEFLRDNGMIDVDIIYKCSKYEVEPLKSDKEIMEAQGGRPYHLYPFREQEQEMALSVLVKPETVAALYRPERCAERNIIVKTNTPPAVYANIATEPTAAARQGTIFPRWDPTPVAEPPKVAMERTVISSKLWSRGRSDSVKKVAQAPPNEVWRPFRTTLDQTKPKIAEEKHKWTAGSAPFLNNPGVEDDQWLRKDLEEHRRNLDEWRRKTWKLCKDCGENHRHVSSKDPSISVPGDDFPIKQPMCETYTEDRDMNHWEEVRAKAEQQDFQDDYECYIKLLVDAELFYSRLEQLLAEAAHMPHVHEAEMMLRDTNNSRALIQQNLKEARQRTIKSGERAGKIRPAEPHLTMPEDLESKWQQQLKAFDARRHNARQQHQTVAPATAAANAVGNTPRSELVARMEAFASIHRAKLKETNVKTGDTVTQPVPRATVQPLASVLNKMDTVPFPAYQEPQESPNAAIAQQPIDAPLYGRNDRAGSRTANITEILNDTGVKRHITFGLPQAQKLQLSEMLADKPSPITPDDWSGTTEGSEDEVATPGKATAASPRHVAATTGGGSAPTSIVVQSLIK